jgi:hypothetical protein
MKNQHPESNGPSPVPPCPASTRIDRNAGNLTITYSWRSRERIRFVTLAALSFLGLSLAITSTLWSLEEIHGRQWALANLVTLALVAAGLFLLLTGRTVVWIRPEEIRVRHRRHFLPQTLRIPGHELEQLYCVRVYGLGHAADGRHSAFRYHVVALDRKGRRIILVPNLEQQSHARHFEGVIEEHLGIVDRAVTGEVDKRPPHLGHPGDSHFPYMPSWSWGLIFKHFMSRTASQRYKMFRDDEALHVTLGGRNKRRRARKKPAHPASPLPPDTGGPEDA